MTLLWLIDSKAEECQLKYNAYDVKIGVCSSEFCPI